MPCSVECSPARNDHSMRDKSLMTLDSTSALCCSARGRSDCSYYERGDQVDNRGET